MATTPKPTTKRRKTKKVERPEIVLVTPKPKTNIRGVTEFELFRLTIDDKPFIGMRVNTDLLVWDKNGYPSLYQGGASLKTMNAVFIDYLTEDEGIYIPGSAGDRPDLEVEAAAAIPGYSPPSTPCANNEIPDGVTYVWGQFTGDGAGRPYYRGDARNFTKKNGERTTLIIHTSGGHGRVDGEGRHDWAPCAPSSSREWGFIEFTDELDEARWLTHGLRKTMGID